MTPWPRRGHQVLPSAQAAAVTTPNPAGRPPHSGLPVASVTTRTRAGTLLCVVTPIDQRGRLADRSLLRLLRWAPHTPVSITVTPELVVLVTRGRGPHTITRQGHLRLPAPIRHRCGLAAGDRLLLAAFPHRQLLAAYPLGLLSPVLLAHLPAEHPGRA